MDIFNSPDSMTSDPAATFTTRATQLAARRKLAQDLIAQSFNAPAGQMVGRVYVANNPWGNFAKALGGQYMANQADKQEAELALQQRLAQNDFNQQFSKAKDTPTSPQFGVTEEGNALPDIPNGPTRREVLMQGDANGLRTTLAREFMKADAERDFKSEQAQQKWAADAAEKQARRDFEESQNKLYRRTLEEQMRLKQAPTIHITNSGGSGSGNSKFAGAATQVGVDARDPTKAVYRIGKTGETFSFDENGQPTAHEGAIAPKPAAEKASTESERSSAGYLGRMEATEKNLKDAEPLPLSKQFGMNKAPGITNMTLSPAQQVQYQQQEDWVRAKLRKESGAVIGDEEMAREIRTYFPQAGDSQAVRNQKAQSRAQAREQMKSSAGKVVPTIAAPVQQQSVAPGTKGMHKGKPVVMGADGEWHYEN
jgi:hypothetical protein